MTSTTQPDGYLATPAAGNGAPVLVLHPWWGLNATIRAFCDRLAKESFLVFAPDLYHGKVTDQIAQADVFVTDLDGDAAKADVAHAIAYLKEQAGVAGITVIGFSLGAYFALEASNSSAKDITKVVVFYGTGAQDFTASQASYLGHFAQTDPYEDQANVDDLEALLKAAGRPVTFYTYPDTGHWFFESDRADAYNEAAAALAWERTLAFLKG